MARAHNRYMPTASVAPRKPDATPGRKPDKKVSTTIYLPPALWLQVRFHGLMKGLAATEVAEVALIEYLERAGYSSSPATGAVKP